MLRILILLYGVAVLLFSVVPLTVSRAFRLVPDAELDGKIVEIIQEEDARELSFEFAYSFYGFDAPEGEDPVEFGRNLFAEFQRNGEFPPNNDPLDFSYDQENFCRQYRMLSCVDQWEGLLDQVPRYMEENRELLSRYEDLQSYTFWHEPINNLVYQSIENLPEGIGHLAGSAYLVNLYIFYLANNNRYEEAWLLWEREHNFFRQSLVSSDHTSTKEVARTLLEENIRLRLLLLQMDSANEMDIPVLHRLSYEERSLKPALKRYIANIASTATNASTREEAKYTYATWWYGREPSYALLSSGIEAVFESASFRPNRFANVLFNPLVDLLEVESLSASEFEAWISELREEDQYFNVRNTLRFASANAPYYLHSAHIVMRYYYDLDRFIVLSQAAEQLLEDEPTPNNIEEWLLAYGADYSDPLTNRPPLWRNGFLSFDNPEQRTVRTQQEIPMEIQ